MKKAAIILILSLGLAIGAAPLTASSADKEPNFEWCCGISQGSAHGWYVMACIPWGNQQCVAEPCLGIIL